MTAVSLSIVSVTHCGSFAVYVAASNSVCPRDTEKGIGLWCNIICGL